MLQVARAEGQVLRHCLSLRYQVLMLAQSKAKRTMSTMAKKKRGREKGSRVREP